MKTPLLILSLILLVVAGCSKERELKKSVYVPDAELTDLPAYSEWGYNTFGAYYDRDLFILDNNVVPAKVSVTKGETLFILDGQDVGSKSSSSLTLSFKLSAFLPKQYSDLLALNKTTYDLTNPLNQVFITSGTTKTSLTIISGTLQFKRAQYLHVDKSPIEVILSGYFEFKAIINDKPVTFSDGRFDVGIQTDNFYLIN